MKLRGALVAVACGGLVWACATAAAAMERSGAWSATRSPTRARRGRSTRRRRMSCRRRECPRGWTGLQVTADRSAKVADLDDVVACTDKDENRTYLENGSRVVWLLSAATVTPSVAVRMHAGPGETSFPPHRATEPRAGSDGSRCIAHRQRRPPGRGLGPRPAADLRLGGARGGRGPAAGDQPVVRNRGAQPAEPEPGSRSRECTKAVDDHASSVRDLARADAAKVLLDGLAAGRCRTAAAGVALTDELNALRSHTRLIRPGTTNITSGAASALALPDGARLLTR